MSTLYMYKGLPGSGKTTAAKTNVLASNGKTKRINKDDLRSMVDGGRYSKANEKVILALRDEIVTYLLFSGNHDVIVDDTNLDPKHEKCLREIAEDLDAKFEVVFFGTDLAECIRRDSKREHPVGEKKITEMYNRYLNGGKSTTPPLQQDKSLPHAIICDLDGTLCHLNGRNPYDASTCGQDLVNTPVKNLILTYSDQYKILFVSGRSAEFRQQTRKWLTDNLGDFTTDCALLMRPEGDSRKDSIMKKELYVECVKDKYYVEFVLDDRNQVVDMWRELGLTCFQVAPGNF
jgi:predicted kinase